MRAGSSRYGVPSFIDGVPNPEYFRRHYQANKEKYALNSRKWQKRINEHKFGVKYPEKTECSICGKVISGKQLNLDHDHKTGQFRGWLCRTCNLGFGWYESVVEGVQAYLFKMLKEREDSKKNPTGVK